MANLLQQFEDAQIAKLTENKKVPDFRPGDIIRVSVKIIEGKNERIQAFEGLCIARKNRGMASAFTVRKISHGEGVERIFPLYSPRVEAIEIVRKGVIRRAKLYYMRDLTGKAARIKEKMDMLANGNAASATAEVQHETDSGEQAPAKAEPKAKKEKAPKAKKESKK